MSLDSDKVNYIASQVGLRPDQRRALHEFLKPYVKNTAAPEISAATSRRLARLDAAAASGSLELRNLQLECARLNIGLDRLTGIDVAAVRSNPRLAPEKRMQLLAAAAAVGYLD